MRIADTLSKILIIIVLLFGAGGFFLWDWLILTDTERVEDRIEQIAEGIRTNDPDKIADLLDESFRMEGMTANELHEWHTLMLQNIKVMQFTVEKLEGVLRDANNTSIIRTNAVSTVMLNVTAPRTIRFKWELVFHLNGKDNWRLRSVRIFDYETNTERFIRKMSGL